MRNLFALIAVGALALPFTAACSHTVASHDETTEHMNGSVSHDETTVKQNDLTGSQTTVHEKSNSNP